MKQNEMEEKLTELQKKGIISFSEWEKIFEYESKSKVKIVNTTLDCFLTRHGIFFEIDGMKFFRLKEAKIEKESELFGLTPKENEPIYFVFINYKDDVVAYIPLEESEEDK